MTAPNCPQCNTPSPTCLGDFYFCDVCGYRWYVESEDIDATEVRDETGVSDIVWGKLWIDVTEARPE